MDLKLDLDTGDMVFVNGTTPITEDYTANVGQRLFILLRTFLAEWYLNTDYGIPYTQQIMGRKIKKSTVDRILQQKILGEQGVSEILSFDSTLDNGRTYSCTFKVRTIVGGQFTETINTEL